VERTLIHEIGRKEGPGRPIIYGTTKDFLKYFGLKNIEELPTPGADAKVS
jgi:segregation and condensation protein B